MIDFDHCVFCQGDLHLADTIRGGWVFVCGTCGRETVLSDRVVELLIEAV